MAHDPRSMRGSLKPNVRFEDTQPSDIAGYLPTERELEGTRSSKREGKREGTQRDCDRKTSDPGSTRKKQIGGTQESNKNQITKRNNKNRH